MRLLRVLLLISVLPAVAALLGALVGSALGRRTMYLVATALGTFGVLGTVALLVRLGWLAADRTRGIAIGGLVGFGLGAPLAAMGLDQPLLVLAGSMLIGLGALVGTGKGAVQ
jgi:hypothetical protein